jgi:hypothetical protein
MSERFQERFSEPIPPDRFAPVRRNRHLRQMKVRVEIEVASSPPSRVQFELGFGEPGAERVVLQAESAPARFSVSVPLGGGEPVSVRFPEGIPKGAVTAIVFFEPWDEAGP